MTLDIPPDLRNGLSQEGPAIVGGSIGAFLAAAGFWARLSYLILGYLLGKYAGPLVDRITGLGGDVAAILAGAFGLLLLEQIVIFLKGIDKASLSRAATDTLRTIIALGKNKR